MKRLLTTFLALAATTGLWAQRTETLINDGWTFHLGHAASMEHDFTHGTEYFTYFSKAVGQNKGPADINFNDSAWQRVTLPHDWVVDLPYASEASHSHGYKQVGWRYPQHSVGWYRKHLFVSKADEGKDIRIRFDGIFRNAQVFCNGFYLGHEPSGYASSSFRIGEYLNYDGDNVITVRCDASTEEGWYYEGAGIYRDVWLTIRDSSHHIDQVFYEYRNGKLLVKTWPEQGVENTLKDKAGRVVAHGTGELTVSDPHLWSPADPYLYTLHTTLTVDGKTTDAVETKVGLRTIDFDAQQGFTLNGSRMKLLGSNLHLDHAGVGVGVPDALWVYKIQRLKALGMNAIRLSHNPGTPAMLNACDSLGMLVIDENRLMGVNDEHFSLLQRMIERDRNHPSVILWSIGNEEWWIESGDRGEKIARQMIDFARTIDNSRPYTYGNAGGFGIVKQVDVHGYNYIVQNDVENRRRAFPDWVVVGTEETSGCGTRNVYETVPEKGWMKSINMEGEERSEGEKNVIERGWKFYRDHPWAAGIFYWTGFDYRGEPNPMKWPATGSQFGILDYCGFPKDEAYYLKAAWTNEPVLHIFPHWNLKGKEGQPVEVWAYANVDEVELIQDGKRLGRQKLEKDGHLVWNTIYHPGRLVAKGYRNGRLVVTRKVETTGAATQLKLQPHQTTMKNDGQDVTVVDVTLCDKKGRFVPDACNALNITVEGAEILGWGNGDPGFKAQERPVGNDRQHATLSAFMGHAQIIVRSLAGSTGAVSMKATLDNGSVGEVHISIISSSK